MPACLENLFLLVDLLNLDPSRSKFPSDNNWSFARHPRNWGPSRGPWSKYSHTHAHMHSRLYRYTVHTTQKQICWVLKVIYPQKWRQSSVIHDVPWSVFFVSVFPLLLHLPLHLLPHHILHTKPWHTVTPWRSSDMTFEPQVPKSILFLFLYDDERTGHALMD